MSDSTPKLRDVSAPLPHPPYPAESAAGSYLMALDHQRINQSATWKLASADLRPWLLMLWFESWQQIPCGSLPDDDELICATIGMPTAAFAVHKRILMRGWERHSDGRLYHRIVTGIVLKMLSTRRAWRTRQTDHREAQPIDGKGVTLESRADLNLGLNQHRTSTTAPVDNSSEGGFIGYWTAKGKALGIEAKRGEQPIDYAKRIRDRHK